MSNRDGFWPRCGADAWAGQYHRPCMCVCRARLACPRTSSRVCVRFFVIAEFHECGIARALLLYSNLYPLQVDGQSQPQPQQGVGGGSSGWIDGGLRERGGGGFSGLSAEANGFVPSNFTPAAGVAGGGEVVGGGMRAGSGIGSSQVHSCTPCSCWCSRSCSCSCSRLRFCPCFWADFPKLVCPGPLIFSLSFHSFLVLPTPPYSTLHCRQQEEGLPTPRRRLAQPSVGARRGGVLAVTCPRCPLWGGLLLVQ